MTIELICTTCGRPFEPTREAILLGPATYRVCPACRPSDELAGLVASADDAPGMPV